MLVIGVSIESLDRVTIEGCGDVTVQKLLGLCKMDNLHRY